MPRLTEGELTTAIKEGKAARAQKARALASALRERGYIIDDDIRQILLLRRQFSPFMDALLTPVPNFEAALVPKPPPVPLGLAVLASCSISTSVTLALLLLASAVDWL